MSLFDITLVLSLATSLAGFYFYFKEKKMLQEFMQQSRRHDFHKELDVVMQKKANRYLILSIAFSFISLPLVIQKILSFVD